MHVKSSEIDGDLNWEPTQLVASFGADPALLWPGCRPALGPGWARAETDACQRWLLQSRFLQTAFTQILDMEILCNFLLTVVRLQKENTALKMDKT